MDSKPGPIPSQRHYFVDEAGDGALFDRRGRVLIGTHGCSQFFIVGFVDIPDPTGLAQKLEALRSELLADPYFRRIPSMQPEGRKTALAFHAKDDIPEVRWQVFSLLRHHADLRFFAVVRDKYKILEEVRRKNIRDERYRYHPNELYDAMVSRLFKTVLHKDDVYRICFARRGASDRTAALRAALETARERFKQQHRVERGSELQVVDSTYSSTACLQVTDYFLWALQRLFERHEDRYLELIWPACRTIIDVDDHRTAWSGTYYTQKKPLNSAAVAERLYAKEEPGI